MAINKTMKTRAFNPFDYMDTQEEINAYLLECQDDVI